MSESLSLRATVYNTECSYSHEIDVYTSERVCSDVPDGVPQ